jgi:hypothetical protein
MAARRLLPRALCCRQEFHIKKIKAKFGGSTALPFPSLLAVSSSFPLPPHSAHRHAAKRSRDEKSKNEKERLGPNDWSVLEEQKENRFELAPLQ